MLADYLSALWLMLGSGFLTWLYSLYRRDVSSVDSLWSLMFLAAAIIFVNSSGSSHSTKQILVLVLLAIWSIRLSLHLSIRNHGKKEDHRYQQIRKNNEPHFEFKSIYIVFGLQAVLAWIICIPLWFGLQPGATLGWLDYLAVALWVFGFGFEAIADWQLFRFKRSGANNRKVLNKGLWRLSRHPNYFGEFCIWWSYYLFAVSAGGSWTVYAPVLMTFLLLKVSGVSLMEENIPERRPDYQAYIESTNAFFPNIFGRRRN
ncbi:MAG: steroid 5-alpha reductase family enzyme [Saprospiraceae bacterium]|jgi:steroid 5-alpha reductase family enzyme